MFSAKLGSDIEHGQSLGAAALGKLLSNKAAVTGAACLALVVALAVLAPWLAPYSVEDTDLIGGAAGPTLQHWLGTDDLGRDLFTRVLFGARVSLMVGLLATMVSVVIGVTYGAVAGYCGGRIDRLMMRAVDVLYALPFTILVILLMVFLGRSIYNLFIALGAIQWLMMARIVRGQIIAVKHREFVDAAEVAGTRPWRILARHILPTTLGPIIIFITLSIPAAILEEAFLSFIGLGVQAPMASWGTLIADGVGAMEVYPWMVVYPSLTLVVTLLALNFLGEGLREALDPRSSKT